MTEEQGLAKHMRAVIFTGHNVSFSHTQALRHKFGLTLIGALCTGLTINPTCGQHAMLLWTISMSMCDRGANMDVCVACLMVCAKMNHTSVSFGLSRFAQACSRIFESRQGTAHALECTLQHETCGPRVHFLTSILKMSESTALTDEVRQVTCEHLKHAERFLLFKSLNGMWYRYLIELYEYTMSRTQGMAEDERERLIIDVCDVQDT